MQKVINWLSGKKTIIGIIAGLLYAELILHGLAPSIDDVWLLIGTWTGISFKLGINNLTNTASIEVTQPKVPKSIKYTPSPVPEPPEVLAG